MSMYLDPPARPWLVNTLLDESFLQHQIADWTQAAASLSQELTAWMAQHFQPADLALTNEAQLENGIIRP